MPDVAETLWKWRCKVSRPKETDFSSKPVDASSTQEPDQGTDAVIKTLYQTKNSSDTNPQWVDYPPRQATKNASKHHDRVAIKVYKVKDTDQPVVSGYFSLKYHKIEIQSTILVTALKDILKKEDVHLETSEVASFTEPFRPLYFRSDEIAELYEAVKESSPLKLHLELLLKLMGDMFNDAKARVQRLQASGLVSFKLAWSYFPKNSFVYSWEANCELLAKVVDTEYFIDKGKVSLIVKCNIIVFDGKQYVWQRKDLVIPSFSGNMPITDLPCYPLRFHENPEGVKAALATRAKKALDYQGLTYCTYTGIAWQCKRRHNVDGRILIDLVGFNKHCLAQGSRETQDPQLQKNRVLPDIGQSEKVSPAAAQTHLPEEQREKNKQRMLEIGEDLALMSPLIEGYALKNKEWLSFYVEDIQPIQWNDEAYDHLVYDTQQKDLVLSFVENHQKASPSTTTDVITGKGEGLIILLSGPPGTGKTLTAEAVADRTRRPLFYLQAEDLGIMAADLAKKLKEALEMATEWGAVILLDEADVFMAQRHPTDITRNELVSIFLRELEYYRGIIFLTTNLYDTIDSAFRSRINLHLLFSPLSPEARLSVWRKFLERLPPMALRPGEDAANTNSGSRSAMKDLGDDHLKELAMWQLNGREIKNAVKMVKAWCDAKGYDITLSRVESAIKVSAPSALKRDHTTPVDLYD